MILIRSFINRIVYFVENNANTIPDPTILSQSLPSVISSLSASLSSNIKTPTFDQEDILVNTTTKLSESTDLKASSSVLVKDSSSRNSRHVRKRTLEELQDMLYTSDMEFDEYEENREDEEDQQKPTTTDIHSDTVSSNDALARGGTGSQQTVAVVPSVQSNNSPSGFTPSSATEHKINELANFLNNPSSSPHQSHLPDDLDSTSEIMMSEQQKRQRAMRFGSPGTKVEDLRVNVTVDPVPPQNTRSILERVSSLPNDHQPNATPATADDNNTTDSITAKSAIHSICKTTTSSYIIYKDAKDVDCDVPYYRQVLGQFDIKSMSLMSSIMYLIYLSRYSRRFYSTETMDKKYNIPLHTYVSSGVSDMDKVPWISDVHSFYDKKFDSEKAVLRLQHENIIDINQDKAFASDYTYQALKIDKNAAFGRRETDKLYGFCGNFIKNVSQLMVNIYVNMQDHLPSSDNNNESHYLLRKIGEYFSDMTKTMMIMLSSGDYHLGYFRRFIRDLDTLDMSKPPCITIMARHYEIKGKLSEMSDLMELFYNVLKSGSEMSFDGLSVEDITTRCKEFVQCLGQISISSIGKLYTELGSIMKASDESKKTNNIGAPAVYRASLANSQKQQRNEHHESQSSGHYHHQIKRNYTAYNQHHLSGGASYARYNKPHYGYNNNPNGGGYYGKQNYASRRFDKSSYQRKPHNNGNQHYNEFDVHHQTVIENDKNIQSQDVNNKRRKIDDDNTYVQDSSSQQDYDREDSYSDQSARESPRVYDDYYDDDEGSPNVL